MPLTLKQIENASPKIKPYKLADSGGLCLLVNPSGAKLWRWRYRYAGKEKMMALGEFPIVTLKDVRERHFEAKRTLSSGIDPMTERKAEAVAKQEEIKTKQREAESSFKNIALDWWAWWSIGKSPRHAATVMARLEADVFPAIGHVFIEKVETRHVRQIVLTIEDRGARDVAKRAHEVIGQIFRFALARGLAGRNPAAEFKPRDILAATKTENYARVEAKELPRLLVSMDGGIDLGRSFNRRTQLAAEYRADATQWHLTSGLQTSPTFSGSSQTAVLHFSYDSAVAGAVSPKGLRFDATAGSRFSTIASDNAPLAQFSLSKTSVFRQKNVIGLRAEANSYFRHQIADPFRFTLGGPLRLSASSIDEYRGTDTYLLRAGYLRRIAALPSGLGQGVYLTGAYEAGEIWNPERAAILRQNFVSGIVASTPLGVITVAGSIGDAGRRKVFFTLGRFF